MTGTTGDAPTPSNRSTACISCRPPSVKSRPWYPSEHDQRRGGGAIADLVKRFRTPSRAATTQARGTQAEAVRDPQSAGYHQPAQPGSRPWTGHCKWRCTRGGLAPRRRDRTPGTVLGARRRKRQRGSIPKVHPEGRLDPVGGPSGGWAQSPMEAPIRRRYGSRRSARPSRKRPNFRGGCVAQGTGGRDFEDAA